MAEEHKQLDGKQLDNSLNNSLEVIFAEIYAKFKIHFYQEMFAQLHERDTSLTTVETLCVETIHALNNPTVNEFASFIKISPPNAAYKINSLINKGYIKKVRSADDRREYHLVVTEKYYEYYNLSRSYVKRVMERIQQHFPPEQLAVLTDFLRVVNNELMPEIPGHLVAGVSKDQAVENL